MRLDHILKHIEALLTKEELDAVFIEADEESSQERLLVFIGNDAKGREQILEITAQDQELGQSISDKIRETAPALARVQFQVKLPFQLTERSAKEVASLICYLNRHMELPGMEMDEITNLLYYRHVLMSTHEDLNKMLIVSIIGVIMYLLNVFSDLIESVASGALTFNNVLEQVVEAGSIMWKEEEKE
jgi:hypothetical protein